jgi:hypothetical protein
MPADRKDRAAIEQILASAIFGEKQSLSDVELERRCLLMRDLLRRHGISSDAATQSTAK